MGETMPRSLRIPSDVWLAAVAKAKGDGTTVTALVTEFLREYVMLQPPSGRKSAAR